MITSIQNSRVQWVRKLVVQPKFRRESQAFVVEGVRLAEEAQAAGWEAQHVFFTSDISERGRQVMEKFSVQNAEVEEVAPHVLKAMSDTENPQGLLAVLTARTLPLPDNPDFLLILDGIRDPGNLGTMLRTAWAAGVKAALLTAGSVDPYSPKVVRAGMGAHFWMPVQLMNWQDIQEHFARKRLHLYLADVNEGIEYTSADFRSPVGLVIGGEAQGAGVEAQKQVEARVHIPMPGKAESLNAAAAAAVLMFEVVRQRRQSES